MESIVEMKRLKMRECDIAIALTSIEHKIETSSNEKK